MTFLADLADRANPPAATPPPSSVLRLSIIVAAWNGAASLERCLASLAGLVGGSDTEVVVVANFDDGVVARLAGRFPVARFEVLSSRSTVPELRAAGIRCATGDVIALAEDHCIFHPAWPAEMRKAHHSGWPVVGGAVENASPQALAWAVCFFDYGKYMLPAVAGVVGSLSGMNVSYRRKVLEEIAGSLAGGFFETFVHQELQARGHRLYFQPSAIVYHQKQYGLSAVLNQFYHLARSYGAMRVAHASSARRALFALGSLALPLLLPARVVVRTLRKRRHLDKLLLSLPYLVLLTGGWSLGEFCGYLGGPGTSAGEWR